jgi:membrane protease YdiL (CAAX protease family)
MAAVSTPRWQDAPTRGGPRWSWLARRPVLAYALLAYAVSWLLWVPYYLSPAGLGLLPVALPGLVAVLGQYGPTVAAFALTAATGGGAAVRRLRRRYGQWRVHAGWYLLAVLGPLALLGLTLVGWVGAAPLAGALGPDGPSLLLEYLLSVLVLKLVFGGALGEEAGWRGFALPRLQARYGALGGSLVLGALWAGWHAPHYLDPARVAQNPPLPFAVGIVALAVVFTWVYNRTGGSLLLAILLHSAINSAPPAVRDLVPDLSDGAFFALLVAGYVAVAGLTIAATRGRLGYHPAAVGAAGEARRSVAAPAVPAGR